MNLEEAVDRAEARAEGLRKFADIVEQHPDVFATAFKGYETVFVSTPQQMRQVADRLGGEWVEENEPPFLRLVRELSPRMDLVIFTDVPAVVEEVAA